MSSLELRFHPPGQGNLTCVERGIADRGRLEILSQRADAAYEADAREVDRWGTMAYDACLLSVSVQGSSITASDETASRLTLLLKIPDALASGGRE